MTIKTDAIVEYTADAGVTIENLLIKDGAVDSTTTAGVTIENILLKDGTIDGVNLAEWVSKGVATLTVPLTEANLAFDPYNRYLDYATTTLGVIDGKLRFYTTNLTRVDPDSANPFGLPTQRLLADTSGGRRLWLDDMGLQIGDIVSFGILAKIPTGRRISAYVVWRKVDGSSAGTAIATGVFGDDGVEWLALNNQTIPEFSVAVDLIALHISGTGTVDIYKWYIGRCVAAYQTASGQDDDGRRALAMLQSDIVANTKQLLHPNLNLAFDPLNRYYAPSASAQLGKVRWYNSANLSQVAPDAAVAFGLPTIRATANGGKRIWLSDVGLKPGDTVRVGLLAKTAASRLFTVAYAFRNAGGTAIASGISASSQGTDAAAYYQLGGILVPPLAVSIDIYPGFTSGTGDIDIYAWLVSQDNFTSLDGLADGFESMRLLQAAAGSLATLDARLDVGLNEDGTIKASALPAISLELSYGQQFLRTWSAQLAKILDTYDEAFAGEQAVVAVIGDSWTNGDLRLTMPLRELAQTAYGAGGVGWVSAAVGDGLIAAPAGVTCTPAGTWTYRNFGTTPAGRGPEMWEALTLDESAPVGKLTYVTTFTDADIHYLKQADGGSFRWQVDSAGWNTVDTANATDAHAVAAIAGQSNASHTLVIEVVTVGTAGIVLFGVDFQVTGAHGVRVHKLGATGSHAASWAAMSDTTAWSAALVALAPDLVIICLGTNDSISDDDPATFRTDIEAVVTLLRAALPLVDILLLAPGDNGNVGVTVADYADAMRDSVLANDFAFFDGYMLLGNYTDANTRGLYTNASHINAAGGRVIMQRLWHDMLLL